MQATTTHTHSRNIWILALGAIGVVFGDIGTSPLYALRECFSEEHGIPLEAANIIGVLSLIFWTIIIAISFKYMAVVMKADNKGEGGILSLMALASNSEKPDHPLRKIAIVTLGLFGAALLYGDGIITPAISVLSAMEGLYYLTPVLEPYVIPLTIFILNAFFLMQRFGTGRIGVVFGPIILTWFAVIGGLGIHGIMENPTVLAAVNPWHAVDFFNRHGVHGFVVLGAVVLVITGGEALYADMGHFGRRPIRLAWFLVAFPALVLNYFGQGALLLSDPNAIANPFYMLAPKWALAPMVALATMATIIASQALVSGIFSLTRQAVQLGYCPRISTIHTSSREIGQIYVPFVNWTLFIGVIWLVLTFKSSSNLAAAYGIAVTGTMVITTMLAYEVAIRRWQWGFGKAAIVFGLLLAFDGAFFGANFMKIAHGGWVPVVMAAVIYLLMVTWNKGRKILYTRLKDRSVSIEEFCYKILKNPPLRVSGTAIYMAGDPTGIPVPLLHNLKHNKVLHERIAILTIQTKEEPFVPKKDRVLIHEIIPNLYRIIVYYGFMETPKMKHILEACRQRDIHFNVSETTFVLGRETILPSTIPGMNLWQEKLFALMSKNAQRPTAFFKIPPNQVIEVGIQVEI